MDAQTRMLNDRPEPGMPIKLASLFGGFLCMLACGSVYGWAVVSKYLTAYSTEEHATMGTMSSLSVYITFHTGLFHDTFGGRASVLLGGFLLVTGWLLTIWGVQNHHSAVMIGVYQCFCGQSVQPLMLAAMENVKNFSWENRGKTSAVVFTGFGLTSVMMAQLKIHLFPDNFVGLVLTMSVIAAVASLFQFFTFTVPPAEATVEDEAGAKCKHTTELCCRNADAQVLIVIMGVFGMSLYYWIVNIGALNAISGSTAKVPDLITFFGICNIIARPVVGFSSDFLPLTRSQLLCIGMLLVSATMFCVGFQQIAASAFLMGIADGFMFAVWPPLTRELHGAKLYGITFSIYLMMFGVGDVFLNFLLGKTIFKPTMMKSDMILPGIFCGVCSVLAAGLCLLLDHRIKRHAASRKVVVPA